MFLFQLNGRQISKGKTLISTYISVFRTTASNYGESDMWESSNFLLLRQKDPFGEPFSENTLKVSASSQLCDIYESLKYRSINQHGQ